MSDDPTGTERTQGAVQPLVMLHGFTQNGRCLGPVAESLGTGRRVMLPDLPGHGSADGLASLDCGGTADMLARRCGAAHWFGYSMGGRIALHVALRHPGVVRSLVVLGASPGIAGDAERQRRRELDDQRAQRVQEVGVAEFCAQWLDAPMFAGLPDWARFASERGANTPGGLSASLRSAGTGAMAPLWNDLAALSMPVLCLAGSLDAKFSATGLEMADAIGDNARFEAIEGAGHAAHLERPEQTAAAVERFLAGVDDHPGRG